MSALIVNNDIVHYEVLGRGRPLVLLHGWVGSWRDWLPAMQDVSSSFRCYALDFWGYGDTAKASGKYSLQSQVELIETFMNELGIMKIALLGHGLGAVIAAQFTNQFPQLVDRLMLVGYPYHPAALHQRFTSNKPNELVQWLLNGLSDVDGIKREAIKMDENALTSILTEIREEQLLENIQKPNHPRLFVYGKDDPSLTQPPEKLLEDLGFQAHHIILEEGGYAPMIADTGKFCRLAKDFLSLPPEESPKNLQLKDEWKRRFR